MIKFDYSILMTAQSQTIANMVALECECKGSRYWKAIERAMTELKENRSITFDRKSQVLGFVSRNSGKTRIVTEDGCLRDACECRDEISYHKALYQIISRYYELEDKADRVVYRDGVTTEVFKRNAKGQLEKTAEKIGEILIWAKSNPKYSSAMI